MSPMEVVLDVILLVVTSGLFVLMLTRPEFGKMMSAWAERHSEETRNKIAAAWVEGYEAGQECERLRGSKPHG